MVIIAITPKFSKKVPGSLIAIIVVTIAVYLMKVYGGIDCIDTIGDRFTINSELPDAVVPSLNWEAIKNLFPVAITIAVLGAIESLLSATVADGVIGDRHDSNTELIAQGAANIITPLFGGIPATGAIARTMTNINNGGKTPVAGIIHAVVLLLILLFLMPLAQYIPMACLAGVLVIVSYNMSGWRTFKALLKNPKSDVTVLLITFFLTIIFDLTIAIEVGLIIACVLFMKRVMETTKISVITNEIDPNSELDIAVHEEHLSIPKGVEVYEINGPSSLVSLHNSRRLWHSWEIAPPFVSSACVKCPLSTQPVFTIYPTCAECLKRKRQQSYFRESMRKYTMYSENPVSMNYWEKKTYVRISMWP